MLHLLLWFCSNIFFTVHCALFFASKGIPCCPDDVLSPVRLVASSRNLLHRGNFIWGGFLSWNRDIEWLSMNERPFGRHHHNVSSHVYFYMLVVGFYIYISSIFDCRQKISALTHDNETLQEEHERLQQRHNKLLRDSEQREEAFRKRWVHCVLEPCSDLT